MLNYYYRSLKDKEIKKTETIRKGSWIFGYNISPDDFDHLVSLGFDEALLEDANDFFEVPRFEFEDGINYLFTRCVIDTKDGELSTAPLLIAISDTNILTLSHRKLDFLDAFAHGRKNIVTTQKVKAIITIIESLSEQYSRSIMKIRRRMLRHFANVESITENDIKEFVGLENTVSDYMSALTPTETALIQMLRRRRTLELHEDDIELVEDLVQDVQQLNESARGVLKTIQNIRSGHSSILANKLNSTMKRLTVVTIILTIPTIIASIFGMNTWLPISDSPLSFTIIVAVIIIASLITTRSLSKSDWIK